MPSQEKIVIVFSPINPTSPRHGAHHRILQQISGISNIATVVLASSYRTTDVNWPSNLEKPAKTLKVLRIQLYERSIYFLLEGIASPVKFIEYLLIKFLGKKSDFHLSRALRKFAMQKWFKAIVNMYRADTVVINYVDWAFLTGALEKKTTRILETLDLITINHYLQSKVIQQISIHENHAKLRISPENISYISSVDQLPDSVKSSLQVEISAYSNFDLIWNISDRDTELARSINNQLRFETILPSFEASHNSRGCRENFALLPTGPNVFNLYSILRFLSNIEPLVNYPDSGKVLVTGSHLKNISITYPPKVSYLGLVDNFDQYLASARFVIAPTSVGTGQQLKIFEALWHGTPVICFRSAAPTILESITHGVVLVDSDKQFAEMISRMWHDEDFYKDVVQGTMSFQKFANSQVTHTISLQSNI